MKKIILFLFFLFAIPAFLANFAAGQEKAGEFSIQPFFQEIILENGAERVEFDLEISNQTGLPAVFRLSVLDFGALDESGGVAFLGAESDLERKYGLASWITLEKDAFVANPGEKQIVKATVENKESLSPGGHYAAILVKLENEKNVSEKEQAANIAFNPSFTSLVFARKVGGEIYGLNLKNIDSGENIFWLPNEVKMRFQNSGNVYLVPRGIVKITDPLGRVVRKGIINEGTSLILPETFRVFPVKLKKKAIAYLPGRYRLSVEYRHDEKSDFAIERKNIDFLPLAVILGCLIIIGGFGYGWREIKRKRKSGEKNQSGNFASEA